MSYRALVPVLTAAWLLALPPVATGQDAPPLPEEEPAAQAREAPPPAWPRPIRRSRPAAWRSRS